MQKIDSTSTSFGLEKGQSYCLLMVTSWELVLKEKPGLIFFGVVTPLELVLKKRPKIDVYRYCKILVLVLKIDQSNSWKGFRIG